MKKYLMSSGLYTTNPIDAVNDALSIAFSTELWSVPSSDIGISHSINGISESLLHQQIGDRIKAVVTKVATALDITLEVSTINFNTKSGNYDTIINSNDKKYEISINL